MGAKGQTGHVIRRFRVKKAWKKNSLFSVSVLFLSLPFLSSLWTQNAICCPSVSSTGPGSASALKAPFTHPLTQGCFCNSIFSHAGSFIVTLEPYTWQDEVGGLWDRGAKSRRGLGEKGSARRNPSVGRGRGPRRLMGHLEML